MMNDNKQKRTLQDALDQAEAPDVLAGDMTLRLSKKDRVNMAMAKIILELDSAEEKHPEFPDDLLHQMMILNEEIGEANQAALQACYEDLRRLNDLREELIQSGAMILRILKHLD